MLGNGRLGHPKMPGQGMPFFTNGWTTTMNIYSQVGLVTLVGLVSKNGILIVEFANVQQERGLSKIDAVRAAAAMAGVTCLANCLAQQADASE